MAMDAARTTDQDVSAADHQAPTSELVTGTVGERCATCSQPLAPDQRYCVNCGERRGRARFSTETPSSQASVPSAAPAPPTRSRSSSATTLIAGVATLLIAMGVGFLIGHDSSSSPPVRASAPAVITVGGGAGAGAAASNGTASNRTASTGARAHTKHTKAKVLHVVLTPKVKHAADAAASKVLGSSGNLSNNVQQQVGGGCSGGAGCENGKFTGNFVPGG